MSSNPRRVTAVTLAAWLDRTLRVTAFPDASLNGLQVGSTGPVQRVAAAVDASLNTFRAAVAAGAGLLVVHHGLFWERPLTLTGAHLARVRTLLNGNLALYAAHLPLDLHPRWGNNAQLARLLGLKRLRPFGEYHGVTLGFGGTLARAQSPQELARRLGAELGGTPRLLALGPKRARRVAVVSGGAGDLALQAAAQGYDTFVTGELGHSHYHACQEAGLNVVLAGHYATETLGVQALTRALAQSFRLPSIFLDFPTNL